MTPAILNQSVKDGLPVSRCVLIAADSTDVAEQSDLCRQQGSVYLEYLSVVLVLVFALFSPLPGTGGSSVFDFALGALKQFGANTAQLLAMP